VLGSNAIFYSLFFISLCAVHLKIMMLRRSTRRAQQACVRQLSSAAASTAEKERLIVFDTTLRVRRVLRARVRPTLRL
jgi:hypothetical protein